MNIQERINESRYNTYTDMAYIIAEGKVGDWLTKTRKSFYKTKGERSKANDDRSEASRLRQKAWKQEQKEKLKQRKAKEAAAKKKVSPYKVQKSTLTAHGERLAKKHRKNYTRAEAWHEVR